MKTSKGNGWMESLLSALGTTITQRVIMVVGACMVTFVLATGKNMVHQAVYQEVANSPKVKDLDSAVRAQDRKISETSAKVDSVDSKVEKLDEKVDTFIEVMGDAFPQFREAAKAHKAREQEKQDVNDALEKR